MLVFMDESGDPGFKFAAGSSTHFVFALVIFDDDLHAEDTALKIKWLRRRLHLHEQFEFKFNKTDNYRRLQFLEAVRGAEFRIRSLVVDKRRLRSDHLKNDKDSLYRYFLAQVVKHNFGRITNARLRLDGSGDRAFKQACQSYLRAKVGRDVFRKLKFVNSKNDSLIQLADMVAGAISKAHRPKRRDHSFKEKISHRIEDLWLFK